jgi:formylglycine-generating enzyme required for sulfatase activity
MRVPPGFSAKEGASPEPYTNTGWAKEIVHDKTVLEMVFIPAGEFMMGSPEGEKGRRVDEGPVHRVRITKPFYLAKHETTQALWMQVMGENPSKLQSAKSPVEQVSWDDCQKFLARLNQMVQSSGFRLPTEAEWEYACRAGSGTAYCFGDEDGEFGEYAWYVENSDTTTHEVGQKKPNAWGLHDTHGNMWEWCQSWYGKYDSPAGKVVENPPGPRGGDARVIRGGSWYCPPGLCRSAMRGRFPTDVRCMDLGCRVALDLK